MPVIANDSRYHIDLSNVHTFATYAAFAPEALAFDDKIKGDGNCSWQVSFSALDEDDNLIIIPPVPPLWAPNWYPYSTWYRLRFGNDVIQSGVLVSVETQLGDDFVSMAGKTWEHYLERWQYPFDPRPDHVNDFVYPNSFLNNEGVASGSPTPAGLAYQAYQRDVILIAKDMFAMVNSVPNRMPLDFSSLDSGRVTGTNINFQSALGDQTYMNSMMDTLSGAGEGFDWWMTWDRKLLWAAPYRFGDPATPTIGFYIDSSTPLAHQALSYKNDGPVSTHVLGTGAGLATQTKLARAFNHFPGQHQFTRLDKSYDFGDVRNGAEVSKLAEKQLSMDLQPTRTIPLRLDPNQFADFYQTFRKGRALWITYDMYAYHIDGLYQIISLSSKDNEDTGNLEVELTLEQREAISWDVGDIGG